MDPSRLKSIRLFEHFSDDQLRLIAPFAEETSVAEGERLVKEGDYSYELIGIEEGTAEVTRGDEHVGELGPGDFFGEIGVMERTLRTATVTATSPMRLITLTRWELNRMEKDLPDAMEQLRKAADERRPESTG
jgi:CRP/FNR family transcriptional regulator, cyclic AMP receptor protein